MLLVSDSYVIPSFPSADLHVHGFCMIYAGGDNKDATSEMLEGMVPR